MEKTQDKNLEKQTEKIVETAKQKWGNLSVEISLKVSKVMDQ